MKNFKETTVGIKLERKQLDAKGVKYKAKAASEYCLNVTTFNIQNWDKT